MSEHDKPLPPRNADTEAFWSAMDEERLVLQRCTACGVIRHYPRPMCDRCYSMEHDWVEAAGTGRVYSWTETHHAFHPGFKDDVPYVMVTVDLDEGVRINAQLRGASLADLAIDQPVNIGFERGTDQQVRPVVRLAN